MDRQARHWLFDILDKIAICERLLKDVSLETFEQDVPLRLAVERAVDGISMRPD